MNLRSALLLVLPLILAVVPTLSEEPWIVREDGVGPVRVGMTLTQLNTLLHEKFVLPTDKDEQSCFHVSAEKHPELSFMIEDGKLSRIEVDRPGVFTSMGIQVGDTEEHVKKVYGPQLKVEPHAYTAAEGGHYLTERSSDGHYGIRFETDGKKVTEYYAGRYKAIQYIEGCE